MMVPRVCLGSVVISICVCWRDRQLQNNALHGPIPEALWQLTELNTLLLFNNKITVLTVL